MLVALFASAVPLVMLITHGVSSSGCLHFFLSLSDLFHPLTMGADSSCCILPHSVVTHTRTHSRYDPSGRGIGPSQRPQPDSTHHSHGRHPCLRRESNPQFQQASGHRPCVTGSHGASDFVCCWITVYLEQVLIIQLVCCSLTAGGTEVWHLTAKLQSTVVCRNGGRNSVRRIILSEGTSRHVSLRRHRYATVRPSGTVVTIYTTCVNTERWRHFWLRNVFICAFRMIPRVNSD
jgi:hypothetical protein